MQLGLSCPVLESQLDQALNAKRAELRTGRSLPTALGNSKKDRKLKAGFVGTMSVFLTPKCWWKCTPDPTATTKSVKKQTPVECI